MASDEAGLDIPYTNYLKIIAEELKEANRLKRLKLKHMNLPFSDSLLGRWDDMVDGKK